MTSICCPCSKAPGADCLLYHCRFVIWICTCWTVTVHGDKQVQRYQEMDTITGDLARTVSGYVSNYLNRRPDEAMSEWLIQVNKVDDKIPKNLYLLCGDSLLDSQVNDINATCGAGTMDSLSFAYKNSMSMIRNFVIKAAKYFRTEHKDKDGKPMETVVFIDTNPALTVYTQLALVAMTDLIVPVSADNFSLQVS
eukprot:GHUV01042260.1.p1 GENE.GHUV01042260.1~~GHUV01042260.1.p1  ORF type:complete len:195 (+),score=28.87 GHUV01042260.1:381-965(+)